MDPYKVFDRVSDSVLNKRRFLTGCLIIGLLIGFLIGFLIGLGLPPFTSGHPALQVGFACVEARPKMNVETTTWCGSNTCIACTAHNILCQPT